MPPMHGALRGGPAAGRPPTRPTRAGKAPSTATTPPSRLLPRWPALLPSTTASATGRPARENATAAAGNDDDDDTAALLLPPRTRGGGFSDADPAGRSSSSYFPGGEDADEEDEAAAQAGLPHGLLDSTVKLFCVHTEPSFSMPWQRKRQFASTSTGFMVAGPDGERWLLTNAHAVEYGTQIKVKRRGDDTKFLATVLAAGTECDIALLSVADPEFWEGAAPLTLGGLPRLQEAVAVVGYPIGGDTISVTSGVVSRIEVTAYVHGSTELLGIQVSAAINSGNSGGPCFNAGGECVGVAFQSMAGSDAENIGYVIPTPVVRHFLTDYARHGQVTGFPVLGIKWQRLESAALRAACGLAPGEKGVLVRSVAPTAASSGILAPDDVITAFDGVPVANDGTVLFRTGERIAFGHLISQKYTGERAAVTVVRRGSSGEGGGGGAAAAPQPLTLDVALSPPAPLVPAHLMGADPEYLVVAGAVFVALSEPYLASEYGPDYLSDSPVKLLDKLLHGWRTAPGEEVVVLSQVLACDEALGYEDLCNVQVLALNGARVHNLAHLAALVAAAETAARADGGRAFLKLSLEYDEVVVLDAAAARAATATILAQHSIPAAVSPGLASQLEGAGLPVWPAGPGGDASVLVSGGGGGGAGAAAEVAAVPAAAA